MKTLGLAAKVKLNFNFFAFFFSIIYFFILGLRKQALIWFGVGIILGIFTSILGISDNAMSGIGATYALTAGLRANALYYRKKVLGQDGWWI